MNAPSLVCESCGRSFDLSASVRARYPQWRPRLCLDCRDVPADSGTPRAAGRVERAGALTTAQVRERYREGPDSGVFTDGSCDGNPGRGGWGAVQVRDGEIVAERHGAEAETTNNRMELVAMIEGLSLLAPDEPAVVYSDSRLVVNTLTQWAAGWEARGWRRKAGAVANLELVQRAYALAKQRPLARIQWIRAHDGSLWNEYADALATAYLRDEL